MRIHEMTIFLLGSCWPRCFWRSFAARLPLLLLTRTEITSAPLVGARWRIRRGTGTRLTRLRTNPFLPAIRLRPIEHLNAPTSQQLLGLISVAGTKS
ncbi:MAG: hypothetical protein Q4P24_17860, partial [Rhodobacterales bacterium]|nr:hypothetical protein [Rhodobacterales bacterium]